MGNPVSKIRDEINSADAEKEKKQERLNVLEKMVKSHLAIAKREMQAGERNDEEIHAGTIVEYSEQVSLSMTTKASPTLEAGINEFFGGNLEAGFQNFIKAGVETILGNSSIGQHEGSNMFIIWLDNALIRLDGYYYRWNFTSNEVIQDVEGASGVIMMRRVIDLTKTDPQVLIWTITREAELLNEPDEVDQIIDEAIQVITKVAKLQKTLHSIKTKEAIEGIGSQQN